MGRWGRWRIGVAAICGLYLASACAFAQTGAQYEQLAPDPILKTPYTPESMLMRAGYEQKHRDCYDAGLHIESVLATNPGWAGALALRLYCERKDGRRVEELSDLTRLIGMQPTRTRWWVERAEAHQTNLDRKLALEDIAKAIELRPWDPSLYLRRVYWLEDLHDYTRAWADLETLRELSPESAVPLRNLADRAALYGKSDTDAVRYRALAEIGSPKPKDAPRKDDDLFTDGMSATELMLRAGYAASLGKFSLELRFLNAALELQPGLQRALEMRVMLGMMRAEVKVTSKVRAPEHQDRPTLSDWNRLQDRLLRPLNPLQDINRLIEIDPKRVDYYRTRVQLNLSSRRREQNVHQILWDYNKIVELEPDEAANYAERGRFELILKDTESAIDDYKWAVGLDPSNAAYSFQLSQAYAARSLIGLEISSLNLALVGDPENEQWKLVRSKLP